MAKDKQQDTPAPKQPYDLMEEKGLPGSTDTERLVLGSLVINADSWMEVENLGLVDRDFLLEKHRRIFSAMQGIRGRSEPVDRVTLVEELNKRGHLESVDGMTYISSLDEGLPEILNFAVYVRIIKDHAIRRQIIFNAKKTIDRALLAFEAPADILTSATEALQELTGRNEPDNDGGQSPIEIIESFPGGPNAFLDPSSRRRGLQTGFLRYDEMTGGLHDGELVIIAARPSMGKSAFALNLLQNVCLNPKQRKFGAIFSLEMSKESLVTRLLCAMARVDQHKFRAGYLNKDEREKLHIAMSEVAEARLKIYDEPGITAQRFAAKVRKLVNDEGLHLVILDYLQLMDVAQKGENRNLELGEISRTFKNLAQELKIPIVALSQLSRAAEKRPGARPELADLRESGNLEQDADTVGFLYREEMYRRDREDLKGVAELLLRKQRNGPVGTIKLRFLHSLTLFTNLAEDMAPDQAPRFTDN